MPFETKGQRGRDPAAQRWTVISILLVLLFANNLYFAVTEFAVGCCKPLADQWGSESSDFVAFSNGISTSSTLYYNRSFSVQPDGTIDVEVTLPPFDWALPGGLTQESARLFWLQPENHRHFNDSLGPSRGVIQIVPNATLVSDFNCDDNETHSINYNNSLTVGTATPEFDVVMYMSQHASHYFQHFLYNAVPHISLMQFACELDPGNITFILENCEQGVVKYLLQRYGFKEVLVRPRGISVSAKQLILPKIIPRLHPFLTRHFVDRLQLHPRQTGKIILVSRTDSDLHIGSRVITNQEKLEDRLSSVFGSKFICVHLAKYEIEELIDIFGEAAVVIGSHGGGLYNLLWASRNASLVEIMPVQKDGVYPLQEGLDGFPSYCHLAFHTLATMNGHPYYRYYQFANDLNYHLNINDFMLWLESVLPF
jgi:hypothetical protein